MALGVALALCIGYTSIFAVQFRMDWIPKNSTLTMNELLWDKVGVLSLVQRNRTRTQAIEALNRGLPLDAIAVLDRVRGDGQDRQIEAVLSIAYRRVGDIRAAETAEKNFRAILDSRLP